MSFPEPFPESKRHEFYLWQETPNETALRQELSEVALTYGEVRTFGETTLPLASIAMHEVQADDDTPVPMESYERHNHSVYTETIPAAGLSVSVIERQQYADTDPVEPIHLGLGMSESLTEPGIAVDIVVPSRHFTEYASYADYPRTPEESQPPHAKIQVGKGKTVAKLADMARVSLAATQHPNPERINSIIDQTERLFTMLDVENLPADETGVRRGEIELTEAQMGAIKDWVNHYFYG